MPGLFILSLDTEIAWGTYGEKALLSRRASFDQDRALIRRLLDLLDHYQIPATWAVVGHLFLDQCDGHPDVLQPHYGWADQPDSRRDPCTDIQRNPWYYGADIIAAIRGAKTTHEIGTHTFTHVMAGDPAVTPEIWVSQMKKIVELHAEHGLAVRSIVYPQNKIKYVEGLPDYGIIAYRGDERNWHSGLPGQLHRGMHLVDYTLGLRPPTYDLTTLRAGDRLVNLPASQFLMGYDGVRRFIPLASRVREARLGLDQAERLDHLYHLWFHPFNLGSSEEMFTGLEAILKEAAMRRDQGRLRVMTMEQAAGWILDGMPGHE